MASVAAVPQQQQHAAVTAASGALQQPPHTAITSTVPAVRPGQGQVPPTAANSVITTPATMNNVSTKNFVNPLANFKSDRPKLTADSTHYAKLLISNVVTGTLIGKAGGTINAIRNQTGCNVKVSTAVNSTDSTSAAAAGPHSFYPGTSDRVVVVSGTKAAIDQAITYILNAINDAQSNTPGAGMAAAAGQLNLEASNPTGQIELRIVVPNSTVALVIGKNGTRINQLRDSTGARIQVSSRDGSGRVDAERIINISGDYRHVRESALMLVQMIQEDPALKDYMQLQYPTMRPAENLMAGGAVPGMPIQASPVRSSGLYNGHDPAGAGGHLVSPNTAGPATNIGSLPGVNNTVLESYCEIYLQIPDDFVGSLVGRNGQHLCDIRSASGARVSISQRGELVPGTRDRLVTVTGSIRSVHAAHILIMQRLQELQDALNRNEQGITGGAGQH